ncbi:acyl-CoA carboxylase epsilon subunit [Streptomyces viridosporus]|uniref:acyl-CoA carboxylase epsilon subunit n=1 Tax=Streptomyces viridosporus TaxID=67581 RepID=UPI0009BD27AE|nr:acyl-CoA carboxylase epsilon subunit [Streptomyces viridosporus]
MGDGDREQPCLRVERGRADEAELAALALVLLVARAGTPDRTPAAGRTVGRPRWWHGLKPYTAPSSWR